MRGSDARDRGEFQGREVAIALLCATGALAAWSSERRDDRDVSRPSPLLIVDPNVAPIEVFSALPRLGPSHAAAIDLARRERPFRSPEDFDLRVRGVGPATMRAIQDHFVFPPSPPEPSETTVRP